MYFEVVICVTDRCGGKGHTQDWPHPLQPCERAGGWQLVHLYHGTQVGSGVGALEISHPAFRSRTAGRCSREAAGVLIAQKPPRSTRKWGDSLSGSVAPCLPPAVLWNYWALTLAGD